MNKNKLFSVLDSKINRALKERNAQNVVDLRLYINDVCIGIFSIKEKEEIYNSVKDIKKDWFIDFYENIDGENRAEYMDIVIYKKDVIENNLNIVNIMKTIKWYKVKCSFYNQCIGIKTWKDVIEFIEKNRCFDYTIMGQTSDIYCDVNFVYEDGILWEKDK